MKHFLIFVILFFFAAPVAVFGQTLYTTGVTFCASAPSHNPGTNGAKWALDTTTWNLYIRSYGTTWTLIGNNWVQDVSGCSAPAYTPTKFQSRLAINACDPKELYAWDGSVWDKIAPSTAGITGTGLTNRLAYWTDAGAIGYESTLLVDSTNNRLKIGNQVAPVRTLDVTGEARISDLTTDTPTRLVGADADGDLGDAGSGADAKVTYWTGAGTGGNNAKLGWNRTNEALEVGGISSTVGNNHTSFHLAPTDTVTNAANARYYAMGLTPNIRTSNTAQQIGFFGSGSGTFGPALGTPTINVAHNNTVITPYVFSAPTVSISGGVTGTSRSTVADFIGASGFDATVRIQNSGTQYGLNLQHSTGIGIYNLTLATGLTGMFLIAAPSATSTEKNMLTLANSRTGANNNGIGSRYSVLNQAGSGSLYGYIWYRCHDYLTASYTTGFVIEGYDNAVAAEVMRTHGKNVLIGHTTTATESLDVNSIGSTSASGPANFANSLDSTILRVRSDRRVGINTATPDVSFDMGADTDGFKMQAGTTAQRPSINNTQRVNTDAEALEYRENGVWFRLGSSQAPTIAAGAGAGTGPTIAVAGSDLAGSVTLTTGTTSAAGALFTVTYGDAFDASSNFYVTFSCRDVDCTGLQLYVSAESSTSFTISTNNAPTDAVQYVINYHVGQ